MSSVKITVAPDGFLKVEGEVELVTSDGTPLPTREGKPIYLCRCGQSKNKPFCDSSHNQLDWDGSLSAD